MSKKYLSFCLAICAVFITSLPTFVGAATLHAIIVADVADTKIGADQDVAAIQKLTDTIRRATCLGGQDIVIEAGRGKLQEINNVISGLSVSPDDVVFFYYSGHGANPGGGDRWPLMGVERGGNLLKLSAVKDTLQNKKPRLLITMADACNVFVPGITQRGRAERKEPGGFKKLFLDYKGSIIASSSVPGQYSYGDPQSGGTFTRQFLSALNQVQASSSPDWESIKTGATKEIPVNSPDQKVQTPQMKVEVTALAGRGLGNNNNNEWSCAAGSHDTPLSPPQSHPVNPPSSSDYPTCVSGKFKVENSQECCLDRSGKKMCFNQ